MRNVSGAIFIIGLAALVFLSSTQDFPEKQVGDLGVDGEAVTVQGTVKAAKKYGNLTFIVISQEHEMEILLEDVQDVSSFRQGQKVAVKGKVSGGSVEPITLELG